MITFLIFCLISSLVIVAIHACTWDGMIFGGLRAWMDDKLTIVDNDFPGESEYPYRPKIYQRQIMKPLYSCIICMASVWGTLIYSIVIATWRGVAAPAWFASHWLLAYVPYILVVCGINVLISGIVFLAFEKNTEEQ